MSDNLIQIKSKSEVKVNLEDRAGLYIKTYGCQMNVYDSQKLERILEDQYKVVKSPKEADLVLVNTCSVRDKPEQKLYSLLGELKEIREDNPNLLIGVGGCVAQQEGDNITKKSKEVDFVFGTHNLSLVPSLVEKCKQGLGQQVAIDYREDWEDLPLGINDGGRVSSFIAISRGCNKNCAYCIVPTTRGKEVSRDIEEIVREAKIAVRRGSKEIFLLGQTVNSYGLDLKPRMKFVHLLDRISEVEGVKRIRFISPHPQEIRSDFYDLVANNPKICRHVHMPLQSGSTKILMAMNRNYKQKRYLDIIAGLRERVPDISITTDIIVGFPGETEEDFQETLAVMREVDFDNTYSYMFSSRPGTIAATMDGHIELSVKKDRLHRLQAMQDEMTARRLKTWVGKIVEILIDGPSSSNPDLLKGRLSQNIVLNLEEKDETLEPGMIVEAEVTKAAKYTLKGRLLG